MLTNQPSITKHIAFPSALVKLVEAKTSKTGISFAEYLRHLILNDVEDDVGIVEYADKELEKAIGEGLEDYNKGRYVSLKNDNEIDGYFDKLDKKADE